MCFVSVIIPVYNVEKYLEECMESILSQTIKNFEVILVDDGSQDNSGKICDKYAEKDVRVKVLHKSNGGQSSARNYGLDHATGDYILYVDSDDYLSSDYLEQMYNMILIEDYDMVIGNTVNFMDGIKIVIGNELKENNVEKFTPEEAMESVYYQEKFDTNLCAKMVKRKIAQMNRLKEGVIYEDFDIIHELIFSCQKIVFLSKPKYFYRCRMGSTMNSPFDEKKFYLLDIAEKHVDFVREQHPELLPAVHRRYVYSNFHILGKTIFNSKYKEKNRQIRMNILKYGNSVLHNKRVGMKEKIGIEILKCGLFPYMLFWKIFCVIKNKKI